MEESRLSILFESYKANTLSRKEILELQQLLAIEEENDRLKLLIQEELDQDNSRQEDVFLSVDWLEGLEGQVLDRVEDQRKLERGKVRLFWVRTVAAVLLAVGLGFSIPYWWENRSSDKLQADILPGSNKAVLRLADGSEVVLNENQSEVILGSEITYADGSKVQGTNLSSWDKQNIELSVPKGGTYKVVLADGSKVWLNADSRLKSNFKGNEQLREVELDGEAYFEIAKVYKTKDGREERVPFAVKTADHTVRVLGTSFNVTAYKDDATRTTLVEGIVELTIPKVNQTQVLKPNQQGLILGKEIMVREVDAAVYTGWKDGVFNFSDEYLSVVMIQIARWYDVEVHFENDKLKQLKFEGVVERYQTLEELLKVLEKAGEVKFEIDGRRLTVKKK